MPFRFFRDELVSDGVRRIVLEQVDRAIAELDDRRLELDEAVHQVRKRCKKIRAVLRLVRAQLGDEVYRRENASYRDTARGLSSARDAAVLLQTGLSLQESAANPPDRAALAAMIEKLSAEQSRAADERALEERIADCQRNLRVARQRAASWPLGDDGFDTISRGLKDSCRRVWKAFRLAYEEMSLERFHDWRKRVKDHAYQLTLLRGLGGKRLKKRGRRLGALAEQLGVLHDLDVFRGLVMDRDDWLSDDHRAALLGLIDAQCRELQRIVKPLGKRLSKARPRRLVARLGDKWGRWYRGPAVQTVRVG